MYFRQVADAAGDGHIALVFDSAGAGAVAHPGVPVLRIGQERHKEDFHIALGQDARQFRELHVVADQDADRAAVGFVDGQAVATDHAPEFFLIGRDVQFFVGVPGPVAAAQIADIEQAVAVEERHRPGDDIDVVADGQLYEPVADFLGISGEVADGIRLGEVVVLRHERGVEKLGEEGKV